MPFEPEGVRTELRTVVSGLSTIHPEFVTKRQADGRCLNSLRGARENAAEPD